MKEAVKTITLLIVTAAVLCVAFVTRIKPAAVSTESMIGKPLFPALDDPLKAKRMRIVTYDDASSRAKEFEVAQVNGVWSLPSHKNYPADAKDQLAAAAAALVDVKVLGPPVSTSGQDQELYGVVEPKPAEDQFGQKGIGKLVVVEDESNKPLAKVIVGKEDKPNKSGAVDFATPQSDMRFVRIPGQDPIYRVALKTDKFSTRFADWIETDLLKINPWDIQEVDLRDYSVNNRRNAAGQVAPSLQQRADFKLGFNDKDGKWTLKDLVEYKDKKGESVKLASDEELDTARLNALKEALHNLKIIDVDRKPAQMSANLKAEKDFLNDAEALRDLMRRGFLPVPVGQDQVEIVSNDGEAIVHMKDGVDYVLRFGEIAGMDNSSDEEKSAGGKSDAEGKGDKAGEEKGAEKSEKDAAAEKAGKKPEHKGGLSRYIMVMAQYNPDTIPKPELQPVPEIKKAPAKPAAGKSDRKPDSKDAKGNDKKASDKSDSEDLEAIEAEQERVEKENRRKQDEYDEKVKKGQQRAKELNSRFADWYYVVDDETYKKIHLGQAEIVKKKTPAEMKGAANMPAQPNPFELKGMPGAGQK